MMSFELKSEFASFRDPSGKVYYENGVLYRQVNPCYFQQYDMLMKSGLYDELIRFGALIRHDETLRTDNSIIIRPEVVPFISYPYEWSFSELKDAALLTLKIHRRSLKHGMTLKDASAYNVQFINGKPVFIDTLSFDFYEDGMPWGAYGQFCRHFLAPLLLMAKCDVRLNRLLMVYLDGIPLDLASSLLGRKGGLFAMMHIVWHSRSVDTHNQDGKKNSANIKGISKKQHLALIEDLIRGIEKLRLSGIETEWGDYYAHTNYSDMAGGEKEKIVSAYLEEVDPRSVWDLGANDGTYSRLALRDRSNVVAFDIDPIAVERNYNMVKKTGEAMLPLLLDATNPSPGIGFANKERGTVSSRQKPDCIMALALIHHLAISNNLPLDMLAKWFSDLTDSLIIEFVPKADSQVKLLLSTRRDIFPDYDEEGFEKAFSSWFVLKDKKPILDSERKIYLWKKE